MTNLVTITAKFFDQTNQRIINLSVKSRYKGSSNENSQLTNARGLFIFQASPNRSIEILARPPNEPEFTIFKVIDSSIKSSADNPVIINLPKSIDDYKNGKTPAPHNGIVSTLFKVVDSTGKVMSNFPVQSRPKGKSNSPDKYTDKAGVVEVLSSADRDIEVLTLSSTDQFDLKVSMNSGQGTKQPILIRLNEPATNFKSEVSIKLVDRNSNPYTAESTDLEVKYQNGQKSLLKIKNGQGKISSSVGQPLQLVVYKPDGKPLNPVEYIARRVKASTMNIRLEVDVSHGKTGEDKPNVDKAVKVDILITMDQMQKMWPKASISKMQPILDELNRDLVGYKLDTRLRQAHFMAQVRQEVGASFSLREQVEYMGPAALKQIGYYRTHHKQADIDGYKKGKGPANGEVIANRMYDDNYRGAKYKLGNTSLGDGWKYLGRGLKQLTGKSNYQDLTNMYSNIWTDEKVDFVKNPDLIEQPKYAVRSAIRFWLKFRLYDIADKGATGDQVDAITKVINKATDSYAARRAHFVQASKIFI